jgi:hypothetical protein
MSWCGNMLRSSFVSKMPQRDMSGDESFGSPLKEDDMNHRKAMGAIGICLVLPFSGSSTGQEQPAYAPFVVLMAPTGDDGNDGSTLDTPILSLNRAQEVIRKAVEKTGPKDVQVRIGPGTYFNLNPA